MIVLAFIAFVVIVLYCVYRADKKLKTDWHPSKFNIITEDHAVPKDADTH